MMRRRLAAFLICAVLFGGMVAVLGGVLVDDTYIHLVYARNLAEHGELSFNRGEPSYGATSPLWVGLLALVHLAGGNGLLWCRILSILFGFLSIALVWSTIRRLGGSAAAAGAGAAVTAADAWLVRWSATGMETSFAVFMTLLFLRLAIDLLEDERRGALLGGCLFLAVLARPETLLLAPLTAAALLFAGTWRRPGRWAWLAVFALLYGGWLLLIHAHTGTYLPLTAGAKQGHPVFSTAILGRFVVPARILGATGALSWIALCLLAADGIRRRNLLARFRPATGEGRSAVILMFFWIVALPSVYVLFDFHVLSRYLLPVSPVVVALAATGIARIVDGAGRRVRRAALLLAAAAVLQNVVFYFLVVAGPTRAFSRGLEETIAGAGRWLAANSEPGSVVAAPDIGAVGWYSGRRVLDLGGLVSPEINRMRRRLDVERIIEEGLYLDLGCDYLLDRHETPARFAGHTIRGVHFTPVFRGEVSNLGIRKPDPVVYVLYRLERGSP